MSDRSDSVELVRCIRCKTDKPHDAFRPSEHKAKRFPWCRECTSKYDSARHRIFTRDSHLRKMINRCKHRALGSGLPFNLSVHDLSLPEKCPICLGSMGAGAAGKASESSFSVDKIVPTLGYVPNNVIVICAKCNRKKQDSTPEELYRIADYVYALRKERGLDVEPE